MRFMQRKTFKDNLKRSFTLSAGWLFADLLLALAMLFLTANTIGIQLPPTPPPATPTAVITPTPPPLPRLELNFNEIRVTIDPTGLLNNSASAVNAVKQQIRRQATLHGRSVGLVVAYGGAPDDSQIPKAQAIARKVYDVLKSLGKEGFAFTRASYYSTLYLLGGSPTIVILDIYLFAL